MQATRSAVAMVNASSRFSSGGELGLGVEIGISTTRLHVYGPIGAEVRLQRSASWYAGKGRCGMRRTRV